MRKETVSILEELRQSGFYSHAKTDKAIAQLQPLLREPEYMALQLAWEHCKAGKGANVLQGALTKLIEQYRSDIEPKKIKKTLL
jgi:hypothetical protein